MIIFFFDYLVITICNTEGTMIGYLSVSLGLSRYAREGAGEGRGGRGEIRGVRGD